jgi:hypothetical protein
MKISRLSLLFSLAVLAILFSANEIKAGVGDTTVVRTLRYDTTMRAGVFQFPTDTTKTYEKIIMRYGLRCKNGLISNSSNTNLGCGEWDYNCNTFIVDSTQTDSLHKNSPSHSITNFSGTNYYYTSTPVWQYTQYTQEQVFHTSTTSMTPVTPQTGTDSLLHPLGSATTVQRSQYLWKATELSTAGMVAGNINGLQLEILTPSALFSNLRIRMKHSTQNALNDNLIENSGFTEVYFLNTSVTGAGTLTFNFSTPFNWDGVSNILVDFSYTLTAPLTGSDVRGHVASFNAGLTTTKENSVLQFGSTNNIQPDTSFLSSITNEITIAFWANGDSIKLPSAGTSIFYSTDNFNRQLNIHLPWTDSNVYWDCGYAGGGFDRIQKASLPAEYEGHWNFWTFTKNAITGNMKIYLNGQVWMSGTGKTKPITLKNFKIGMTTSGTNQYYGMMDEISVWNKELNASEINNIMNHDIAVSNPNYANLMLYYNLDENTGTVANNGGSSALPGQIVNPVWRSSRGKDLWRNFTLTTFRPDVTFVQGVFTDSVVTTSVYDSVLKAANSVIAYNVVNSRLHVIDTTYSWPAGLNYVVNDLGVNVDTLTVSATDTIAVTTLDYYAFRPSYVEIINFITPYGIGLDLEGLTGRTYEFDVTDLTPVLKGARYLEMTGGGQNQEDNDIQFVFYEGTPPRNVLSISNIWPNGTWGDASYSDIYNNILFEPRQVQLDPAAAGWKLKSCISGHGQEGEFVTRNHTIRLNNSINYTRLVKTECATNPIYPQGGTWVYDRAGWCPGAAVDTKEFEITPNVTPGQLIMLDYSLPFVASPGTSNYRINNQLVSYGPPNNSLDASIYYIRKPSKRPEFLRVNPICDDPEIVIRNTGSTSLTSLTITYGRVGGTMSTYNWTGNLNFLDTATVILPANNWTSSMIDQFSVTLSAPNGGVDQYAANDTMTSELHVPASLPSSLVFEFKTNSTTSNAYTIKDDQGNIVLSRNGSIVNHTYLDSITLPSGCYTLVMTDGGDDGLEWWANANQGAGYFQIWDGSGNFLHAFDPDFGDNIYYQFTIGYNLPVQEIAKSKPSLEVFPNPASDFAAVKVSAPSNTNAILSVTDIVGKTVWTKSIRMSTAEEHVYIDINNLRSGIYLVKLETENYKVEEKMVVTK